MASINTNPAETNKKIYKVENLKDKNDKKNVLEKINQGYFGKRTGTTRTKDTSRITSKDEHGDIYERYLCNRIAQVLEEKNLEFNLANNMINVGCFDDVVCKFKSKTQSKTESKPEYFYFLLQAKHAQPKKSKSKNGESKDIPPYLMVENLKDYVMEGFISYKHMKDDFSNYRFELAYVTNMKCNDGKDVNDNFKVLDYIVEVDQNENMKIVLGSENGKCYKAKDENSSEFHNGLNDSDKKLMTEFLSNFRIYLNYYNNEKLKEKITKDMEKPHFNKNDFERIDGKVKDWMKLSGANIHCLKLENRLFLTVQLLCCEDKLEIENYKTLNFNDEYLSQIFDSLVANKIIFKRFIKQDKQVHTTLCQRLIEYIIKKTETDETNHLFKDEKKVLFINETIEIPKLEFVLTEKFHFKLIIGLFEKKKINADLVRQFQDLSNIDKYVFLLVEENVENILELKTVVEQNCKHPNRIFDFTSFSISHVEKDAQNPFMGRTVSFQGNYIILEDLISTDELISVSMISKFWKNKNNEKIEIGEKLEDLGVVKSYYIPRDFLLNNVNTFVALFKQYMVNKDVFCYIKKNEDEKYTSEQQPNFKLIRNKEEFLDHVQENKDKNVHLFENTESGVKYVETKGSPDVIDTKITKNEDSNVVFSEDNFIELNFGEVSENRFICISDIPGNGKSIMLKSLSIQLNEKCRSKWIVLVDLTLLKSIETVCDTAESVIDVLVECLGYTDKTTEELFRKFCMLPHKVILLLDAYDEISSHYEERVQSFLEALKSTEIKKIIVATRQHCVNDIKNKFPGLVVFNMIPFSKRRQKEFITKYWEEELSRSEIKCESVFVAECVDKLVEFIQNLKVEELKKITGVPLLIKIFAETYYRDVKKGTKTKSFTITDEVNNIDAIYSKFFSEKFKILFEEKYERQDGNVLKDFKNLKKYSTLTSHTYLALREILSEDVVSKYFEFEKMWPEKLFSKLYDQDKVEDIIDRDVPDSLGVVTKNNDNYVFIHRTFAEYFCAIKIISQIHSACDSKLINLFNFFLSEILIKDEYIVIRKFLNENILNLSVEIFPNEKYKVFHVKSNCKKNILYHLSYERLDNIYKWLKQCIHHNGNTKIFYSTILNKKLGLVFQMGNKNEQQNIIDLVKHILFTNYYNNFTKHRESLFLDALRNGYVCIVETMIENAPELVNSYRFKNYDVFMSALEYVCKNAYSRQEEIIKLLFEKGAVANNESKYYISMPLIASVQRFQSINVIELLVENGADVNVTCEDGKTPLMYAAIWNKLNIVELLITKYRVDVNFLYDEQYSALYFAVIKHNIEIVQFMLDHGAIVHSNTLIKAVMESYFEITELLLERGGDVANAIQDSNIHKIFKYIMQNKYLTDKVVSKYKLSEIESFKKCATEIINLLNKYRTTTNLKVPDISMINEGIFLNGSLIDITYYLDPYSNSN